MVLDDLVSEPRDVGLPADCVAAAAAAALSAPVVLFARLPQPDIRRLIQLYRADGKWPIFAVLTAHSRSMVLADLLAHLLADRQREEQMKTQKMQLPDALTPDA
jgi:hypothetical protein